MATSSPQAKPGFAHVLLSRTTLVCALTAVIALGLGQLPFFKQLEVGVLDYQFKWRPAHFNQSFLNNQLMFGHRDKKGEQPILLSIGIGDRELQKYGTWPWPTRQPQVELLSAIDTNAGPAAIAYDVVFGIDKDDPASREADAKFAEVLQQHGTVCLAGMRRGPIGTNQVDIAWVKERSIPAEGGDAPFSPDSNLVLPNPPLRRENVHLGLINNSGDRDGVIRRVPIVCREGNHWIPSLALRTAMIAFGVNPTPDEVIVHPNFEVRLKSPNLDLRIPVEDDPETRTQQLRINYRGKLEDFPSLNFQDVIDWRQAGASPSEMVGRQLAMAREGVVVVGFTATGQATDLGPTPMESRTPFVTIQINAISNLLQGDFLRTVPWWGGILITIAFSVFGGWSTQRFTAWRATLIVVSVLLIYTLIVFALFFVISVWTPWVIPTLGLLLPSIAGVVMRLTGTEEHVEKLTDAFQTYLSSKNLTREKLRRATTTGSAEPEKIMPEELARLVGLQDHGTMIGMGKFNLLCKLGQGGMGAVFLGRQKNLRRFCAIKVLNAALAEDKDAIGRFLREAQSMANLQHPNLVGLFDCDQYEGQYYIAMEFVEGLSLGDILRKSGALPLPIAFHFLKQAAQGMAYYQERGIVHRDIKPDNMMIDAAGTLKITDLGLAKNTLEQDQGMTVTGTVMGSPYYMSPEQINDSKNVDARADLYSLGIAFYQMITGKVPFSGASPGEVCMAHLQKPMPSVELEDPTMTQALDALIARIVAKDRDERVPTAAQLLADIEPWVQTNPVDEASQQIFGQLDFAGRTVAFLLQKNGVKQELIDADLGSIKPGDDLSKEAPPTTATQVEKGTGGTRATIPQIGGDQTVMRGTNVGTGTSVGSGTEQTIIKGTTAPVAPAVAAASAAPAPVAAAKGGRLKWAIVGIAVLIVAAGAGWFFFLREPAQIETGNQGFQTQPEPSTPPQPAVPKPETNAPPPAATVTNAVPTTPAAPPAEATAAPATPTPAPAPAAPETPPATPPPAAAPETPPPATP